MFGGRLVSVGCGTGVRVGRGVLVGATCVRVGGMRVRVGRGVLVGTICVRVGRGVLVATTRVRVGLGVRLGTNGVRVGLGVLVTTIRVLVGRSVGVFVWVGRSVAVLVRVGVREGVRVWVGVRVAVGVRVGVSLGALVSRVLVGERNGDGVRVTEAVTVGVGVREGSTVLGGVRVGAVPVGNGPRSAFDVNAIAVMVRRALDCMAARPGDALVTRNPHTTNRNTDSKIPSRTCGRSEYSFQREFITVTLHSAPGQAGSRSESLTNDGSEIENAMIRLGYVAR